MRKGLQALIALACFAGSQVAMASAVLLAVYDGNDGINMDGSTQLEADLAGLSPPVIIPDVFQLARVDWDFSDSDGDPLNGITPINPQSDNGLTITGITFKPVPDSTEAIEVDWSYTGPGTLDYITFKADNLVFVYDANGMTSGTVNFDDLCMIDGYCNMGGKTPALSHSAAYSVVPVPAAVWLFGSGLLGLVGVARRKKVSA